MGIACSCYGCECKENEKKMRKDMMNDAIEMLEVAGVKNVTGYEMVTAPWAEVFMKWEQHDGQGSENIGTE